MQFRISVDHGKGVPAEYPQGWLIAEHTFAQAQDWSKFKALEFYLHTPSDQPLEGGPVLKYGLRTRDQPGRMTWRTLAPELVRPGDWTRVVLPLNRGTVTGDLSQVTQFRCYIAESWYDDGAQLTFHIDDLALLTEYRVATGSGEPIREAGREPALPPAYEALAQAVVYPVIPLEFVYPDTDLTARPPLLELRCRAARGETVQLTFAIVAGKQDVADLRGGVDELRSPAGGALPSDRTDLRVVKVWEQAALHWEVLSAEDSILVPELLLKDDRLVPKESRSATGEYVAPHILDVPFGTDIAARTVKQLWLNLDIPRDLPPGQYRGRVSLRARSGLAGPLEIPLRLEVLPLVLPEPKLLYGVYYRWRPERPGTAMSIPKPRLRADLRELAEAGFSALTVYDPDTLETLLEVMQDVGMAGPVVIMGGRNAESAERLLLTCETRRVACYFYGIDEPNSAERLAKHKELSALLHEVGGRVMTAILPRTAQALARGGQPLDWANHSIQDGHAVRYLQRLRNGATSPTAPFETYYWQVYEENPTRNRLLCGLYLWNSGLGGAFPYEYQGMPAGLPYTNDTRESMHNVKGAGPPRIFRAWCLTYPSQEGPVSTLQWEGCRAGITDVRYLTLLEQLLKNQTDPADRERAAAVTAELAGILAGFTRLPVEPDVHTNPYWAAKQLAEARTKVQDLVLKVGGEMPLPAPDLSRPSRN